MILKPILIASFFFICCPFLAWADECRKLSTVDSMENRLSSTCLAQVLSGPFFRNKNFDKVGCQVSDLNQIPEIILIGETHSNGNPNSSTELIRMIVRSNADSGQLLAGYEGMAFNFDDLGNRASTEYEAQEMALDSIKQGYYYNGIEDPIAYSVGLLPTMAGSLRYEDVLDKPELAAMQIDRIGQVIITAYTNLPFLQNAWRNVERPLNHPNAEALAKKLDWASYSSQNTPLYSDFLESFKQQSRETLLTFIEEWLRSANNLAALIDTKAFPSFRVSNDDYYKGTEVRSWEEIKRTYALRWRNKLMAANTGTLFCAAGRFGLKKIVLFVGDEHVPGLKREISKLLLNSEFSPDSILFEFGVKGGKYTTVWDLGKPKLPSN